MAGDTLSRMAELRKRPRTARPATSRARSRSSPRGSSRASASRRCSARPGPARRRRWRGRSRRSRRPALVIAHNKTLAAQLCNEFREFFPRQRRRVLRLLLRLLPARGVRPAGRPLHREGLVPQRRHRAVAALRDVVAASLAATSSSSPRSRASTASARRRSGASGWSTSRSATEHDRDLGAAEADRGPVRPQRHGARPRPLPGKGDVVEVQPANQRDRVPDLLLRRRGRGDHALRPAHRRGLSRSSTTSRSGRRRSTSPRSRRSSARSTRSGRARAAGRDVRGGGEDARGAPDPAAHRVRPRDDEGARLLQRDRELLADPRGPRRAGSHPFTLLDYFPDDFVVFVDESHQTVPQLGGMYEGDRSRKQTLVDFGFRLPSALDNRPLRFDEFLAQGAAARVRLGDAGAVRAAPLDADRRAADPADRDRRSRGRAARDEEPDRRPAERDPARARRRASASSSRR